MKVIIAGGRNYVFASADYDRLDLLHSKLQFSRVVSGQANGADRCGEVWAFRNAIQVDPFPAKWNDTSHPNARVKRRWNGDLYDADAGFRRNEEMAVHVGREGACVLFPGGPGTADMHRRAVVHGLMIFDWRK